MIFALKCYCTNEYAEELTAFVEITPEKAERYLKLIKKFNRMAKADEDLSALQYFDNSPVFLRNHSSFQEIDVNELIILDSTPRDEKNEALIYGTHLSIDRYFNNVRWICYEKYSGDEHRTFEIEVEYLRNILKMEK